MATQESFWAKVKIGSPDDCWEWQAGKLKGYGLVSHGRRTVRAHRLAYEFTRGPIPRGLHCLHECDNPSCVNPKHLFLGTHLDNMRDRDTKGRGARLVGCKHGGSKLTQSQVVEIRRVYAAKEADQRGLAKMFGVCQRTICKIIRGVSYQDCDDSHVS